MASSTHLQYAKFATISQLLTSIVTEKLVPAYFIPLNSTRHAIGACVSLRPGRQQLSNVDDILAVVALRGIPIIGSSQWCFPAASNMKIPSCREIKILHPQDMIPPLLYSPVQQQQQQRNVISNNGEDHISTALNNTFAALLKEGNNPTTYSLVPDDAGKLWDKFAKDYGVADKLRQEFSETLESSIEQQSKNEIQTMGINYVLTIAFRVYL